METLAVENFFFTSILYCYYYYGNFFFFLYRRLICLLLLVLLHIIRYQSFSFCSRLNFDCNLVNGHF